MWDRGLLLSMITALVFMTGGAGATTYPPVSNEDLCQHVAACLNISTAGDCSSYAHGHISTWDTSQVTSMASAFRDASSFNQPIGGWNTGKVTDMSYMLAGATSFNQNLDTWSVSNVENMDSLFYEAFAFNASLSGWDVSRVTNMRQLFKRAATFEGADDLSSWDVSRVTTLEQTFMGAYNFKGNIDSWNVAKVTDMVLLFWHAEAFTGSLSTWNTSACTNMDKTFGQAYLFNGPIGSWDTSKVSSMQEMLQSLPIFNQPIGGWNTGKVTSMNKMLSHSSSFNQGIDGWDVSNVNDLEQMFDRASSFNNPLNSWNTASVNDLNGLFRDATTYDQPMHSWDTARVVRMDNMFSNANSFNQHVGMFETSNVVRMSGMFERCATFNQDISAWDVSSVQFMGAHTEAGAHGSGMFTYATSFNQNLNSWDVSRVKDMAGMFLFASAMNGTNVQDWKLDSLMRPWANVLAKADGSVDVSVTLFIDGMNDIEIRPVRSIAAVRLQADPGVTTAVVPARWFESVTDTLLLCKDDSFFMPAHFTWTCESFSNTFIQLCNKMCVELQCQPTSTQELASQGYQVTRRRPEGWVVLAPIQDQDQGNQGTAAALEYENLTIYTPATTASSFGSVTCVDGFGIIDEGSTGAIGIACPSSGAAFAPYGCEMCKAGTFGVGGSARCVACPPGFVQPEAGQSSCKPCVAGTHSGNQTTCSPCIAGTFADIAGYANCTPCPIGRFSTLQGSTECTPCDILGSFYTSSAVGSTECDACLATHYRNLRDECVACDAKSMDCPDNRPHISLQSLFLNPGYHRARNTTDTPYIKACPYEESCLGGRETGDAACKPGSSGPLCAVCLSPGYYMDEQTNECIECGGWTTPITNAAVLLVVLVVCCIGLYRQQKHVAEVLGSGGNNFRRAAQFTLRASIMPKVKILFPFLNLISCLGWLYGAEGLFSLDELLSVFGRISMDLSVVIPLGCFVERTALLSLVISTVPLVAFTALVLFILVVASKRYGGLSNSVRELCYSGLVFLWLLAFPLVSSKIFKTLRGCDWFEDASYMRAAYNVECGSSQYQGTVIYAALAMFVYPIGVPAATLFVLAPHRHTITAYQDLRMHMRATLTVVHAVSEELSREKPNLGRRLDLHKRSTIALQRAVELMTDASKQWGWSPSNTFVVDGSALDSSNRSGQAIPGYALRRTLEDNLERMRDAHVQMNEAASAALLSRSTGPHTGETVTGTSRLAMAYETYGYYRVWYWEVFENIRKLTLVGMVVVISQDPTDRVLVAVAVEVCSLYLYGVVRPYRENADNLLAQACRALSVALLLSVLAVNLKHIDPDLDETRSAFTAVVLLAALALLGYALKSSRVLTWVYHFFSPDRLKGSALMSGDYVESTAPERPEDPYGLEETLGPDGPNFLMDLMEGNARAGRGNGHRISLVRGMLKHKDSWNKNNAVVPVPGTASAEVQVDDTEPDDVEAPFEGGASSRTSNAAVVDGLLAWAVDAAATSHFYPESRHNLQALLGTEPFTRGLTDDQFLRLRSMCTERDESMREPLLLFLKTQGQGSLPQLDPPLRKLPEIVQEKGSDPRIAQDNAGAVFTPKEWDWSNDDKEKMWAHVLVLIGMALNDGFQRKAGLVALALHGDSFDGFQPAPVKGYNRMAANMASGAHHRDRAQPRPNLNIDIVRCRVQVPTVTDLAKLVDAVAKEFGSYVHFHNGFDTTQTDNTGGHLGVMTGCVLYESGVTIGELMEDVEVQKTWAEYGAVPGFRDGEPNARRRALVRAAIEFLHRDDVAAAPANMLCEVQMLTRSTSEARKKRHTLRQILRASDQKALHREFSTTILPEPKTLIEAASQGEFDVVKRLMTNASEQSRREAMQAAENADHWESVAILRTTFKTTMDIPDKIDLEMSNNVQGAVQKLWKDRTEQFWPSVIFSYATGTREGLDAHGAGPGLYLCAMLIQALDAAGIDSFSGLHVLPGQHWKTTYYDRLSGPKSQAKVMIVLLTKGLFRSMACLGEVFTALEQGLQLVPIRAEDGLPPGKEQWPMDLWGDRKETETAEEYQARVDATLAKIKKVKKGLGSFNHLPPRGLFQDLINVELPRLIDLLVTKMGALDPVKVFASMRFPEGKPMEEALELQQKLVERGIDLHIVEPKAGRSIASTVFADMAKCVGFVAMGNAEYGERTASNGSSYYEVIEWQDKYQETWGPIIPVRLIDYHEEFLYETAQDLFAGDAMQLMWESDGLAADRIADKIADRIEDQLKRHPIVHGKKSSSADVLVEKAKSFLWQQAAENEEADVSGAGSDARNPPPGSKQQMRAKGTSSQQDEVDVAEDPAAMEIRKKKIKKVKKQIQALPPKEERSDEQNKQFRKLKKEFLKLKESIAFS